MLGESPSALSILLLGLAVLLLSGTAFMLALGIWNGFLAEFVGKVRQEDANLLTAVRVVGLRQLSRLNRRLPWPGYRERVRRKLAIAGLGSRLASEEVLSFQEIGFALGSLSGLFVLDALGLPLAFSLLFGVVGLWCPYQWVNDQIKKRHFLITRALPFNLDLLTLAVEAGLGFTAALSTVIEKGKGGPLRDELQRVIKELKMGKTREEALRSLIARVELPALTSFVSALIQADRMGTSLGKVLRIQSTQLRLERTNRAEKLANQAPVKMLFPLIACIFPAVFLVLFGPILFKLVFGNLD
jgi:tight adherence protein C